MSKAEKNNCRLIDLSHTIEHGMITYKGLPGPVISDYWTREASEAHYEQGTSFHIGRIDMVANTSTYIDSPFHRYDSYRMGQVLGNGEIFRRPPLPDAGCRRAFAGLWCRPGRYRFAEHRRYFGWTKTGPFNITAGRYSDSGAFV